MRLKFIVFIITAMLSLKHIVGRGNENVFYSKKGYSIVGTSSLIFYVSRSIIECAFQCAIEEGCRTSSFDNSAQKCYPYVTDVCPEIEAVQTSSILYIGKTDVECIDPWKAFKTNCYYFGMTFLSMKDAQNVCEAMNGKLVKIDNSNENEWINSMVQTLGPPFNYCIGLQKVNGKWRWLSDNSTPDFTNWNTGQPSGDGSCARLSNNAHFAWNDNRCGITAKYICEKC